MPSPAPLSRAQNKTKKRKKPKPSRTVPCLVCGERLRRISASHLRAHGLTVSQYTRVYSPSLAPTHPRAAASAAARARAARLSDAGPEGAALVRRLAEEVASDPSLVFSLADEVADVIMTGPLRDRTRTALVSVLAARLEEHGRALAQLRAVNAELAEDWRRERGGKNGGPTPTATLVSMGELASREVARGEDLVVRAVKLALEEQRNRIGAGQGATPPGARYTGSAERVPLPPEDLEPGDREVLRIMLGDLTRALGRAVEGEDGPARDAVLEGEVVPARVEPEGIAPPDPRDDPESRTLSEAPVPSVEGVLGATPTDEAHDL